MKERTANDDFERFQTGAAKYAAYLETPEGQLRLDLAFANLQDFLPQATGSLHALDIGCGTGALAVRLARLGVAATYALVGLIVETLRHQLHHAK